MQLVELIKAFGVGFAILFMVNVCAFVGLALICPCAPMTFREWMCVMHAGCKKVLS